MSPRPVVRRNLSTLNNTPAGSFLENRPVKKSRGNKSAQVPENLRGNLPPIPWRELHAATGKIPRTRTINSAFTDLRSHIPTEPRDRKLSKIETLHLASSYIRHLWVSLQRDGQRPGQPAEGSFSAGMANWITEKRQTCHDTCTFCVQARRKPSWNMDQDSVHVHTKTGPGPSLGPCPH